MEFLYEQFLKSTGVSTDSRKVLEGQMFFALSGEHFDGSKFIESAFEKGASCAVTQNPEFRDKENVTVVEDTLVTLQELSNFHRNRLSGQVIALTGSNGKTTTKELLAAALSTKFKVSKTIGNFNNHIGVPLSLLKVSNDIEFAIIEMGANQPGDIKELCEIAQPDFGFITNIGLAHLEGFGSIEGVFQTKTEMFRFLKSKDRLAFVDHDLTELSSYIEDLKLTSHQYNVSPKEISLGEGAMTISLTRAEEVYNISPKMYGIHNVQNYVAAADIAHYFGVPYEHSVIALSDYQPDNMRSQLIEHGTVSLFLDAYNANVSSMSASINHFAGNESDTILVLGDMKELGDGSIEYHQEIVDQVKEAQWKAVVLVGPDFTATDHPETYLIFSDIDAALKACAFNKFENCNILIKGSRSMKMERILNQFDQIKKI